MRLRAQITINMEASDFIEAAGHQDRLESLMQDIRSRFGTADMEFREVRSRSAARVLTAHKRPETTGRLNRYEEG